MERRRWAFQLLCVYVASGLGLLLTTSFLGLRRYLRRRGVEIQDDITKVDRPGRGHHRRAVVRGRGLPASAGGRDRPEPVPAQIHHTAARNSSRYAFGGEAADARAPDSQSFAESDPAEDSGEQGALQERVSLNGGSQNRANPSRGGPRTSDSDRRDPAEGEPADKGKSSDDRKSDQTRSNESQSERSGQGESDQNEQNEQEEQQAQAESEEEGESTEPEERTASKAEEGSERTDHRNKGQPSSENVRPREQEEKSNEQKEGEPSRETGSTRRSPRRRRRDNRVAGFQLPRLDLALGGLLKLLLYAVILRTGRLLALEIASAKCLRRFSNSLRELAEFFGRGFSAASDTTTQSPTRKAPKRRHRGRFRTMPIRSSRGRRPDTRRT